MSRIKRTALVFCDDQFGKVDGKTAAGLLRRSDTYAILGVIDRKLGGRDAGFILDEQPSGVPIFKDLESGLRELDHVPDCYIYGKAPLEVKIPERERHLLIDAMSRGMDIVSGLHQFFSEDAEMIASAAASGAKIHDVRKPPSLDQLHVFTGKIRDLGTPVVAMLGTDCACGKMTTAVEIDSALREIGIHSVLVATGQTCMMQGARFGVSIDALVSQFVVGEIEHAILSACEHEAPDIILVEGQSSVSHPAFMGAIGIVKGSCPDAVVLQHAPARKVRCDFPNMPMPTVEAEIAAIENISPTKVIALSLSHEGIDDSDLPGVISHFEGEFGLPTTDVLKYGTDKIVHALIDQFPALAKASTASPTHSPECSAMTADEKGHTDDLVVTAH